MCIDQGYVLNWSNWSFVRALIYFCLLRIEDHKRLKLQPSEIWGEIELEIWIVSWIRVNLAIHEMISPIQNSEFIIFFMFRTKKVPKVGTFLLTLKDSYMGWSKQKKLLIRYFCHKNHIYLIKSFFLFTSSHIWIFRS